MPHENAGNFVSLRGIPACGEQFDDPSGPSEGQGTVVIGTNGSVTVRDSQNQLRASGTRAAVADTSSYIYDGIANEMPDPLYGMFTFRSSTNTTQQDVFVMFEGNAVIFSSFATGLPLVQNGQYNYFYGVGLK